MENSPKIIPVSIQKSKLVALYYPMSERFIRAEINRIILEKRKTMKAFECKTDEQLIRSVYVMQSEFVEFAKIYGCPDGYVLPENK